MAALSVASAALVPPPRLPDLFPVLVSATAFLHFLGTFIYFHIVQFSGPPGKKSQKKYNWSVPRSVIRPWLLAIFVSTRKNTVKHVCSLRAWKLIPFPSIENAIQMLTKKVFTKCWATMIDERMSFQGLHVGFRSIMLATDPTPVIPNNKCCVEESLKKA